MSEGRTSPAPVSLPDDDDLLREILLRLPPLPFSVPRASLVCKRWRRVLTDPVFLRRFRAHHRTPPLLGVFDRGFNFVPMLSPPDRIPHQRFSWWPERKPDSYWHFHGCRHGLAAFFDESRREALVWEPFTGCECRIAPPLEMKVKRYCRGMSINCSVLSTTSDNGHGYGGHLSPFKFALLFTDLHDKLTRVCLYESESGKWGNISSIALPSVPFLREPSVLVGNALYWYLESDYCILKFDLDRQDLVIIQIPEGAHFTHYSPFRVLRTEDGGLGLAILSKLSIELWGRKANSNGVVRWVLQKTIELDKLLSLTPASMLALFIDILGYDEDSNVIFLMTVGSIFTIQLESMQFKKVLEDPWVSSLIAYPYRSFSTAVYGGDDEAETLNNT